MHQAATTAGLRGDATDGQRQRPQSVLGLTIDVQPLQAERPQRERGRTQRGSEPDPSADQAVVDQGLEPLQHLRLLQLLERQTRLVAHT